jgi:hypothetical protein
MVRSVHDRFDLGPAGDPGRFVERAGRLLGNNARQPADRTLAKGSVDVNQTLGSSADRRHSLRDSGCQHERINHAEANVYPFCAHLEETHDRLRREVS